MGMAPGGSMSVADRSTIEWGSLTAVPAEKDPMGQPLYLTLRQNPEPPRVLQGMSTQHYIASRQPPDTACANSQGRDYCSPEYSDHHTGKGL